MKSRRIILAIIAALVMLAVIISASVMKNRAISTAPISTSRISIKIGSILPLSGDYAAIGEEIKEGAEIARSEARQRGVDVEYMSEDDAFSPAKAASAASKLTTIDKVDAIFTGSGEEAKPIAHLMDQAQVPLLVALDSNADLKKAGDYIFSIGYNTEKSGDIMARYAYEKGIRKVALLSHTDEVAELLVAAFRKTFVSLGGTIASDDKINPTETKYQAYITKIKSEKVDGVYFAFLPPSNQLFMRQTSELGLRAQLMGIDGIEEDEIKVAGQAAENIWYTTVYTEHSEALLSKFKSAYHKEPASINYVSLGYDAMTTLIEAGKDRSQHPEFEQTFRNALTHVKTSLTTSAIDMNGGQYSERTEKIFVVKNGKSIPI